MWSEEFLGTLHTLQNIEDLVAIPLKMISGIAFYRLRPCPYVHLVLHLQVLDDGGFDNWLLITLKILQRKVQSWVWVVEKHNKPPYNIDLL